MIRVFLFALLIGSLLIVGNHELRERPSASAINARQIELFNSQLDTLHEEVAASRGPGGFAWLALIASIGVPNHWAAIGKRHRRPERVARKAIQGGIAFLGISNR
jgi:hypothetical protein